jgi:hypothetical protein
MPTIKQLIIKIDKIANLKMSRNPPPLGDALMDKEHVIGCLYDSFIGVGQNKRTNFSRDSHLTEMLLKSRLLD